MNSHLPEHLQRLYHLILQHRIHGEWTAVDIWQPGTLHQCLFWTSLLLDRGQVVLDGDGIDGLAPLLHELSTQHAILLHEGWLCHTLYIRWDPDS